MPRLTTQTKKKKTLEFNLLLEANTYTNYSSLMLVLPIYIKKATDATANIDATMMVVNNFFAPWLKELDIKHYLTNK